MPTEITPETPDDDAYAQRDGFERQEHIEDQVREALENGETEFDIPIGARWFDKDDELEERSSTISVSASSIDEFWEGYFGGLDDYFEGLREVQGSYDGFEATIG